MPPPWKYARYGVFAFKDLPIGVAGLVVSQPVRAVSGPPLALLELLASYLLESLQLHAFLSYIALCYPIHSFCLTSLTTCLVRLACPAR